MQRFQVRVRKDHSRRIVRGIHNQHPRVPIHKLGDFVKIDAESIFGTQVVVSDADAQRLGYRWVGWESGIGKYHVRSRLSCQEKQNKEGFGGSSKYLNVIRANSFYFRNCVAQFGGAGRRCVRHAGVQQIFQVTAAEREQLPKRSNRPGTGRQIVFNGRCRGMLLRDPLIQQERRQSHRNSGYHPDALC